MSVSPVPLEDDPCDVIAKAMRGLGLGRSALAAQSGLAEACVEKILGGAVDDGALQKIAPVLGLSAGALTGLPSYRPAAAAPPGFKMITSPFGHAGVNSFVLSRGREAVVFDTGTDATPILDYLAEKKLRPAAVVITHRHPDHTAGARDFGNTPVVFPEDMEHGQCDTRGGINFTALDVSGHAKPAKAYYSEDLSLPVCVLGDCLFAGSMGGAKDPLDYRLALETLEKSILPLPENTVLAPGHGPLTTLDQEKQHNPFLKS